MGPFMAAPLTPEEYKRHADEAHAQAIAAFPFELIETRGEAALATWEEPFLPTVPTTRGAQDILAAADGLRHPEDLIAKRALEEARGREHLQQLFANPDARLPQGIVVDADGVQ